MSIPPGNNEEAGDMDRRSVAQSITERLRGEILAADIAPGTPLRQDHIAKRFGVSQAPVREALGQLLSECLVVYHLNRGVRVASLDPAEAAEISQLRLKLEPDLIAAAARRFRPEHDTAAKAAIEHVALASDVIGLLTANEAFHDALYTPAAMTVTHQVVRQLRGRYARYLGFMWRHGGHAPASLKGHRQLLALVRAGDAAGARRLLKTHIEASSAALQTVLARESAADAA
jgi:DNA-binding GntR family transcriptional regulator